MNPLVQPDPGLYIWTIVTFLVLLALLAKFAWGPLLDALEKRQDAIRKSLDDARQAKEALVKHAERQIEMQTARAVETIRHEAVDLSVAIASKILRRDISKEDNERLIQDTLKEMQSRVVS